MTGRLLRKVLPPPGLPRAISFQSAVIAIGGGTYITGSVVFFTHVLRLSPLQIGVGLSISGLASLVMSLPMGGLADRLGGQRSWVIGAVVEALGFASYPLAKSFAAFVVVIVVTSLADTFAGAGRTIYTADALPPEGRVRTLAFARSYLNVGFTIGAGLGAAALAFNSTVALVGIVLLNATILLVNAVMVARMSAAPIVHHDGVKRSRLAVLKDAPFLVLSVLFALLWVHGIIFSEIIPLWAITHTDAPKPLLGGLFAINTVMAVTLQVRATRGADSLPGSVRLLRRGAVATAIACPVLALSGRTHGWVTIAVIASAVVLTTCTELWTSAVQWYFQTDVVPAAHRGAYVGTARMVTGIANMVAPAGLTLLAIQTGGWGWWAVAAIFAGCWFVAAPAVGWVARTPRIDGQIPAQRTGLQPAPEPV